MYSLSVLKYRLLSLDTHLQLINPTWHFKPVKIYNLPKFETFQSNSKIAHLGLFVNMFDQPILRPRLCLYCISLYYLFVYLSYICIFFVDPCGRLNCDIQHILGCMKSLPSAKLYTESGTPIAGQLESLVQRISAEPDQ